MDQCSCYINPSSLSARELVVSSVPDLVEFEAFLELLKSLIRLLLGQSVVGTSCVEVFADRQLVIEYRILKYDSYQRSYLVIITAEYVIEYLNLTGCFLQDRAQYIYRGGFSRSVFSEECEELTFLNFE